MELSTVFLFILIFLPLFIAIYSSLKATSMKTSNILVVLSALYITSLLQKIMAMLKYETGEKFAVVPFFITFLSMIPLLILIGFTYDFSREMEEHGGFTENDGTFTNVSIICLLEIMQALIVSVIFYVGKSDNIPESNQKQADDSNKKWSAKKKFFVFLNLAILCIIVGESVALWFQKELYHKKVVSM